MEKMKYAANKKTFRLCLLWLSVKMNYDGVEVRRNITVNKTHETV